MPTLKDHVGQTLKIFFSFLSRTFAPRRHAAAKAIEASLRSAKVVLDVRGGAGSRAKIRTIQKEINGQSGSKFIKRKKIS